MLGTHRNIARSLTAHPIVHLFFSFSGRLSRGGWWLAAPVIWIATIAAFTFYGVPLFGSGKLESEPSVWFWYLGVILVYANLSLMTKRLKDRGWSNWFIFVCLLAFLALVTTSEISHYLFKALPKPGEGADKAELLRYIYAYFIGLASTLIGFVVSMFLIIDNAFMSGTSGPNRHGPDPQNSTLGSLPSHNRDHLTGANLLRLLFQQSMLLGGLGTFAIKRALLLDAGTLFEQIRFYLVALMAVIIIFYAFGLWTACVLMWSEAGRHGRAFRHQAGFVVSIIVCLGLGGALVWMIFSSFGTGLRLMLSRGTLGALGFEPSGLPLIGLAIVIGFTIWIMGNGKLARILAALYRPAWVGHF